jgi:hypothetical protein
VQQRCVVRERMVDEQRGERHGADLPFLARRALRVREMPSRAPRL